MHAIIVKTLLLGLFPLSSCLFTSKDTVEQSTGELDIHLNYENKEAHRYGGWYCPDNLNTYPAVNLADWNKVPVVEGRLPTEEEARGEASLILVDTEKYPNAKALNTPLPQLAKYHNPYTNREDVIIIIQAIKIQEDSIVGFRFLNGGNGSARLNEVQFITQENARTMIGGKFVQHELKIKAADSTVWSLMTAPENATLMQITFDPQNKLAANWRSEAQLNYYYASKDQLVNTHISDNFWGNCYVQNDFKQNLYTEKFFLIREKDKSFCTLKIVCGPYLDDYPLQEKILLNWAKRIKDLGEFGSFIPKQ